MDGGVFPSRKLRAGLSALGGGSVWTIRFRVDAQLQTNWCWAAVSSSVSGYFAPLGGWTQCVVVDAEFVRDCCRYSSSDACNQPWYLDRALNRVGHLDRAFAGSVSPADMAMELEADRPIGLRVGWRNGGGHFLAVCGMQAGARDYILQLSDPIFGVSVIEQTALLRGGYQSGGGSWTHSYIVRR